MYKAYYYDILHKYVYMHTISCSIVALAYQLVVLLCVCVSIGENLSDSGIVMLCFGQATKNPLHKVSSPNLSGNQDTESLWSTSLINIFRLPSPTGCP